MKVDFEDPWAVMHIIRRTLNVLYSKEIIDIDSTSDINATMPAIMDRSLQDSDCPFNTLEDSSVEFLYAIDALQSGNWKSKTERLHSIQAIDFYWTFGMLRLERFLRKHFQDK
jgi:hypothetical protein